MKIPRFLLTAGASGSGKTMITCGILQALKNRRLKAASFKCGPDYIDPMFHTKVIGTKSRKNWSVTTEQKLSRLSESKQTRKNTSFHSLREKECERG